MELIGHAAVMALGFHGEVGVMVASRSQFGLPA